MVGILELGNRDGECFRPAHPEVFRAAVKVKVFQEMTHIAREFKIGLPKRRIKKRSQSSLDRGPSANCENGNTYICSQRWHSKNRSDTNGSQLGHPRPLEKDPPALHCSYS